MIDFMKEADSVNVNFTIYINFVFQFFIGDLLNLLLCCLDCVSII